MNNAAAAAKSRQSCPTLCDPMDGSPPGSSVSGILQARMLEWLAICSVLPCSTDFGVHRARYRRLCTWDVGALITGHRVRHAGLALWGCHAHTQVCPRV